MDCKNGVWRVQGSLAVSRAIGDLHLKEWVISEPEIHRLPITPDCEFLIMASDGLWDKVLPVHAIFNSKFKVIVIVNKQINKSLSLFSCVRMRRFQSGRRLPRHYSFA